MKRHQIALFAACAVGLVVLAGIAWMTGAFNTRPASYSGQATIGGPFTLVDQNGRPVDETLLRGKWTAVFFGFTYCPDVCPTTLQAMGQAQDLLGPKAKDLQVVFVSVDPERDTPAQIKSYLSSPAYPQGVIGLTGTPEQVAAAAKAYRVYYKKNGEGTSYLVDHSTPTYLMNPQGGFDRILPYAISPEEIARQVSQAMG